MKWGEMTTTTSLAASTLAAFFRLAAHDALEGLGAARLAVGLIVTRLAEGDAVVNVKAQFGVVCPGLLVMGYETRATLAALLASVVVTGKYSFPPSLAFIAIAVLLIAGVSRVLFISPKVWGTTPGGVLRTLLDAIHHVRPFFRVLPCLSRFLAVEAALLWLPQTFMQGGQEFALLGLECRTILQRPRNSLSTLRRSVGTLPRAIGGRLAFTNTIVVIRLLHGERLVTHTAEDGNTASFALVGAFPRAVARRNIPQTAFSYEECLTAEFAGALYHGHGCALQNETPSLPSRLRCLGAYGETTGRCDDSTTRCGVQVRTSVCA